MALAFPVIISAQNRVPALSLCDLIENRNGFDRQVVEVRGRLVPGGHGDYLAPLSPCKYALARNGYTWPNILYLAIPNNRSRFDEDHAPFEPDLKSLLGVPRLVKRLGLRSTDDIVVVTFSGLFVTYSDADLARAATGGLSLGFGPLGLHAPAKLLTKSATDVSVIRSAK